MVIGGGGLSVDPHIRPLILADNESLYFGADSNSCIYYDGADTFWDLQAVGTGALMIALAGSFPSPDPGTVHIWKATAGTVDAHSTAVLVLEDDGDMGLQLLAPAAFSTLINFGRPGNPSAGRIRMYGSTDTPASTLGITVNGNERLLYSTGAFAFQEATIISTTTGDLTLNPAADVQMGSDVFIEHDTNAALTAGTTQTQANGLALTTEINEIAVVANPNDTVVLPAAAAGRQITIINNGANILRMYPALGDNLGAGVDAFGELETNEVIDFVAYDATNWHVEASTETAHAEMFDTDNSVDFDINSSDGDDHGYRISTMAAGDLAGWTFDGGGANAAIAIASIADGAAPGVDIEVTTSTNHGFASGDIVVHTDSTNLGNAAYVGHFVVKAIISDTEYEVAAVFASTGTGFTAQPATLKANVGAAGEYLVSWAASASIAGSNDNFDFSIHVQTAHQTSTNARRFFGANDVGSISGVSIISIAGGDQVSFAIANTSDAGHITLRDFTLVLVRL